MLTWEMVCRDWLRGSFPRLMCHERKRDHGIWDGLLVNDSREGETSGPLVFSHVDTASCVGFFPPLTSSQKLSSKSANRSRTHSFRAAERFLPLHCPLGAPRGTLFPVLAWSPA